MIVPNANTTVPQILANPDQWHVQVLIMAAILVVVGVLASFGVFIILVLSPFTALAFRRRRAILAKAKTNVTDTSQDAQWLTASGEIATPVTGPTRPERRPRHLSPGKRAYF
jgi:type III secretory pathway component EscV